MSCISDLFYLSALGSVVHYPHKLKGLGTTAMPLCLQVVVLTTPPAAPSLDAGYMQAVFVLHAHWDGKPKGVTVSHHSVAKASHSSTVVNAPQYWTSKKKELQVAGLCRAQTVC